MEKLDKELKRLRSNLELKSDVGQINAILRNPSELKNLNSSEIKDNRKNSGKSDDVKITYISEPSKPNQNSSPTVDKKDQNQIENLKQEFEQNKTVGEQEIEALLQELEKNKTN